MESTAPWKDKRWLPGVLNKEQMIALMKAHLLLDADLENADNNIDEDASALDLHLSDECYKMLKGSIKPFNKSYREIITDIEYAKREDNDDNGNFLLETGNCYLFKIKERLHPCIKNTPIYGQATAKSSVGRLDVIARLIVDGMKEYEKFDPEEVDSGEMFLEITPITFNVLVAQGKSISQLRFFYGKIEHSLINDEDFIRSILNLKDSEVNHGTLSVDISNTSIDKDKKISAAAYVGKKDLSIAVELGKKFDNDDEKYFQNEFWEKEESIERFGLKSIKIEIGKFYILRSKERISLPEGVCIYCRAMDETLGEMRIHYAGFVHPLFGDSRKDSKKGTPLIFEVRGHNVEVLLTHGEILARLFFYRMSQNVDKAKHEKNAEEKNKRSKNKETYNDQELTLSNLFQPYWV